MSDSISAANHVLKQAARGTLATGGVFLLGLLGLASYGVIRSAPGAFDWRLVGLAVMAVWAVASTWTRYRELTNLTFTDEGFALQHGSELVTIPWSVVEHIELGRRGFRVRAHGHRPFSVNLSFVGDTRPLTALIMAKWPTVTTFRP